MHLGEKNEVSCSKASIRIFIHLLDFLNMFVVYKISCALLLFCVFCRDFNMSLGSTHVFLLFCKAFLRLYH